MAKNETDNNSNQNNSNTYGKNVLGDARTHSSKIVTPIEQYRNMNFNNFKNKPASEDMELEDNTTEKKDLKEENIRNNPINSSHANATGSQKQAPIGSLLSKAKDAKDAKGLISTVVNLKKKKWLLIGAAVVGAALIIFVVAYAVFTGGGSSNTSLSFIELSEQKLDLSDANPDDYENFWDDVNEHIENSNVKYYKRFNRIYNNFIGRFTGTNQTEEVAKLEASKIHVLATMFFDYAPENFNSNINEEAPLGERDNIYLNEETEAYKICERIGEGEEDISDEDCGTKLFDSEYNIANLLRLFNFFGTAEGEGLLAKYLNDRASIRNLVKHFIVYKPYCEMYSDDMKWGEPGSYIDPYTYEYNTFYTFRELLAKVTSFTKYKEFEEYQNCKSKESPWLKENGGGWDHTFFGFKETVDFCAYYGYLIESDYFLNHVHFKPYFDELRRFTTNEEQYQERVLKLKLALVESIIDVISLSNDYDPIYSAEDFSNNPYSSYTLSKDVFITIANSRVTKDGYEIPAKSYPLDQYVEGVIGAEVLGAYWGSGESKDIIYKTLQAFAVSVRSYALSVTNGGTKSILNSSANQVFTDLYLKNDDEKYVYARNAALSTAGKVLEYNGKVIMAEYSSFAKGKNYYQEGDLCYTTYKKIGGSNPTEHTVIAKCKWGLAGGHNRGMSQWGALYLSSLGYTAPEIVTHFYGNDVSLVDYDPSGTTTSPQITSSGMLKEKMLVCNNIFYNSTIGKEMKYTLEIPVRITSTDYANYTGISDGSNFISIGDTDDDWGFDFTGGKSYAFKACLFQPNQMSLVYSCNNGEGTGRMLGLNNNKDGKDVLGAGKGFPRAAIPHAMLFQSMINDLTRLGFDDLSNSGAKVGPPDSSAADHHAGRALDIDTRVFNPRIFFTESPNNGIIDLTDVTSVGRYINNPALKYTEQVDITKLPLIAMKFDDKSIKDKAFDSNGKIKEGMESHVFSKNTLFNTNTYFYVKDVNKYKSALNLSDAEISKYLSTEIQGVINTTGIGSSINYKKYGVELVTLKGGNGTFFDWSAYIKDHYNIYNPPGGLYSGPDQVEAHHYGLACSFYYWDWESDENSTGFRSISNDEIPEDVQLQKVDMNELNKNYCCGGEDEATLGGKYGSLGENLKDGIFTTAWKMSICSNTLEGKELLAAACAENTDKEACENGNCYLENEETGERSINEEASFKVTVYAMDYSELDKANGANADFGELTREQTAFEISCSCSKCPEPTSTKKPSNSNQEEQ